MKQQLLATGSHHLLLLASYVKRSLLPGNWPLVAHFNPDCRDLDGLSAAPCGQCGNLSLFSSCSVGTVVPGKCLSVLKTSEVVEQPLRCDGDTPSPPAAFIHSLIAKPFFSLFFSSIIFPVLNHPRSTAVPCLNSFDGDEIKLPFLPNLGQWRQNVIVRLLEVCLSSLCVRLQVSGVTTEQRQTKCSLFSKLPTPGKSKRGSVKRNHS